MKSTTLAASEFKAKCLRLLDLVGEQGETLVITKRGRPVAISAITFWEIAVMVARGRLEIDEPLDEWLEQIESHPLIAVMPLTARIAAEGARLGAQLSKDPADRIIVATARVHGLRLLTADERIRRWGGTPVI